MTRDVERHHSLEEDFGSGMEGEEGIAIDVEELASRGVGTALQRLLRRDGEGSVEAEKLVEPFFDWISGAVSDRSGEGDLLERSSDRSSERGRFL